MKLNGYEFRERIKTLGFSGDLDKRQIILYDYNYQTVSDAMWAEGMDKFRATLNAWNAREWREQFDCENRAMLLLEALAASDREERAAAAIMVSILVGNGSYSHAIVMILNGDNKWCVFDQGRDEWLNLEDVTIDTTAQAIAI